MSEPPLSPLPIGQALLVSDGAHLDPGSGKWYLLGIFSTIRTRQFPATQACLAVYFAFSEAQGRVPLRFRIVDADESRRPVAEAAAECVVPGPLHTHAHVHTFRGLSFPAPGEYRVQVFACGDTVPLMERRLQVLPNSEPGGRG